jgi:4a-hydroxytetrahydrobiopterin dehydratase
MSVLHRDEIASRLEDLPGWHHRGNALEKRFECGDFNGSLAFVNAVAKVANELDHHPDIAISWGTVTLTLCSHDAGGITDRDFKLAIAVNALPPKQG